MRGLLPLFLLLTAGLAGCSDGGGDGGGASDGGAVSHGAHGANDAATHILAPTTWQVGHWWTWSSAQTETPFTYAVAGEAGQDWLMATDNAETAFFDARSDISFLGPVRKSDLAGSQGTQRVEFFRFPLTADKNWTTTWDDLDLTVRVASVKDGKADLEARQANGTLHATFTYDSTLSYFGRVAFYAPDGTTVAFEAKVTNSGEGFSGDLVRWTLETLFEIHDVTPRSTTDTVTPGYTDVWLSVALHCTSGAITLNFGPATGPVEERGFSANGPCPMDTVDQYTVAAPTQQELWGMELTAAPTTVATLDAVVLLRTQTLFKAGSAP